MEKFGFELWGHLPNIADFDGIECGHVYYGIKVIIISKNDLLKHS